MSAPQTPKPIKVLATETPASLKSRNVITSIYVEEEDATYCVSESESDSDEGDDAEEKYDSDAELTREEISNYVIVEKNNLVSIAEEDHPLQPPLTFYQFLIKNEIPRKLFHSFHGFSTLWFYTQGYQKLQFLVFLWAMFFVLLLNDIIRFRYPSVNKRLTKWFGFVIRDTERDSWNGIVFYLAGLALVFSFAPKDICVMSVLLLSWADTAASTFGRQFGKYTPKLAKGKSLAGSLASGFTGIVVCYLFYGYFVPQYARFNGPGEIWWTPETSRLSIHTYALVCGFAASVSEAIDVANIDDNFTIPVLSSLLLSGAVWVFRK